MSSAGQRFSPSPQFAAASNNSQALYDQARELDEEFWAAAAQRLTWNTEFTEVLNAENAPFFTWFADGDLNVSVNCLDRHVQQGLGDKIAIHWVSEDSSSREDITYQDLLQRVCQAANALTELGVEAGQRVVIYLPMIPQAIVTMLACARIGAIHSVVFAGFSAQALSARIADTQPRLVVTSDGQMRKGQPADLKTAVDEAIASSGQHPEVLVVQRTGADIPWDPQRDTWWHDLVDKQPIEHTAQFFPAEHPLFILYTSGTTGTPKGIVHCSGGYLTQASFTHHHVFDHKPEDVYWCTADIGWITGHTYGVYGPLSNAATTVVVEGTPDYPTQHRHCDIIEQLKVSIYYTAPTLIRTFMKWGESIPADHDLSSLRVLGSVGEPINPGAWEWYHTHFGAEKTPIVDTWWQTETGAIMVSPLPGVSSMVPGSAMTPIPGIQISVVNEDGEPTPHNHDGNLVVTAPWPSMLRGIWGNSQRYQDTYWSQYASHGYYFAGDGARIDEQECLWVLGRIDDVMNISGHRLSTSEVESALVSHPDVAEAAVVGAQDETTGQAIVAFVILRQHATDKDHHEVAQVLRGHVSHEISPIAKPRDISIVPELPKTRSGKIMRRLLRNIANGTEVGDVSTLADPKVITALSKKV